MSGYVTFTFKSKKLNCLTSVFMRKRLSSWFQKNGRKHSNFNKKPIKSQLRNAYAIRGRMLLLQMTMSRHPREVMRTTKNQKIAITVRLTRAKTQILALTPLMRRCVTRSTKTTHGYNFTTINTASVEMTLQLLAMLSSGRLSSVNCTSYSMKSSTIWGFKREPSGSGPKP